MKYINITIEEIIGNTEDIINKSKKINGYNNCLTFVQQVLDFEDKKDLPKLKFNILLGKTIKNLNKLKVGDLLEFNKISHYAIYLGNETVIEVEQWGEQPRIVPLIDVLNQYEGTTSIYRKEY